LSGITVTYHDPHGNTYAGHSTTFVSASQIKDSAFKDASDPGTWTVTVVNPGSVSSTAFNFTVQSATPTVSSISPTSMTANNTNQTLTINGTNFQSGDYVQFYWTKGSGALQWNTGNTPTIVSSSQITISMNLGTVTDTISVRVCNSTGSCTSGAQSVAVH
jgi:hypothetical protein